MKNIFTRVVIALVVLIGAFLWLRHRPAPASVTVAEAPSEKPAAERRAPPAKVDGQVQQLQGQLAREESARERAEEEAAALRKKIAPLEGNVVVSFGTVEEMGKRAGTLLPALSELQALRSRDPASLTPAEKKRFLELQRDHAQLLGALPEITHFQDNPLEYGRFFSSMLQQAAGLTDEQAGEVNAYMLDRGTMMNQLGLNSAKKPSDGTLEDAWEKKRDEFNEETAEGLKGLMPAGAAQKAGFNAELMEFLEMDFDKLTTSK